MRFSIITLFPEMFDGVFGSSIIKRAQEKGQIQIELVDLRDFGIGRHKVVDDKPYGGGVGMVLRVDVLDKAIKATRIKKLKEAVVLMDPKGEKYSQEKVETFSKIEHLIIICGHYEGYDERVRSLVDYEISIGDFVMSGGELPAMLIVESVARLVPKVLDKEEASAFESFSRINSKRILEHPQYTIPGKYKGKSVPKALLSGNPKIVDKFRLQKAINLTRKRRPDLLK